MPRLQILQHKSYHPYLEKNKDRVRKDEERAAVLEADEERRMIDANSSARLQELRARNDGQPIASSSSLPSLMPSEPSKLIDRHRKKTEDREATIRRDARKEKAKLEFDWPAEEKKKAEKRAAREAEEKDRDRAMGRVKDDDRMEMGGEGKHINFWAGLEKETALVPGNATIKKPKPTPDQIQADDPTTMYLNRPERETKPWYTDPDLKRYEERGLDEQAERKRLERKRKEELNKNRNDPMTLVQTALSSVEQAAAKPPRPYAKPLHRSAAPASSDPLIAARLQRESSERSRALAVIQEAKRKQAAAALSMTATPSTAVDAGDEWGDSYYAADVREARRRKEAVRGWAGRVEHDVRQRGWDDREDRNWRNGERDRRRSQSSDGRRR